MALMDINVSPLGTGSTSVGRYVAGLVKVLDEKGLPYQVTDMGTIVEGRIDDLFDLARRLHEGPFLEGLKRVYTVIKIDDRRDKEVHLGQKAASITGERA